ncbi:recombinase family protein [Rummeliibacillus sp. NPDC094406]|uniref:recombinase family protein n=1 Tax=Rummeliibacillus sp. NPDC094406 TaxID=3364511 RepID=UPI00380A0DB1
MERKISSVAVYVRKSREDETEEVINRQQAILVELCQKNKWAYEIFKEVASSQTLDRPQLQKMLDKVKAYSYDGVVVNDLDRLSRNTTHFGIIKEELISAGCKVITPNKIYDFTKQEDDLFSDIQSVLAKNEYQTIKRRLVRGSIQSAKEGNWMGKKTPIGYKYNRKTKRLETTEDATIILRLFNDYASGMSTKDIAYQYSLEGVKTSNSMVWSPSGVNRLLNNPAYKGDSLYRKTKSEYGKRNIKTSEDEQVLVEGTHDPIVSKELWNKVQELKQSRNSRPIPLKLGKHPFSGFIRCALCNRVHSFQTSKGGKKRISSCQTRHYIDQTNYTVCKNQGANMDDFEELFYGHLESYLHEIENHKDLIQEIKVEDSHKINVQIRTSENDLKRIGQEIRRVQKGYLAEIFTEDETTEQIKNLRARENSLKTKLEQLEENKALSSTDYIDHVISRMKGFLEGKDILPPTETNNILREFVDVIYYKKINKEIELDIVWKDFTS